ncbi:MAG: hypothetical protein WBW33_08900 [Bryobacteraceae bacterium]
MSGGRSAVTRTPPRRLWAATIEAGSAKFERTAVITVEDAGEPRMVPIRLKGGKDVLKLN